MLHAPFELGHGRVACGASVYTGSSCSWRRPAHVVVPGPL